MFVKILGKKVSEEISSAIESILKDIKRPINYYQTREVSYIESSSDYHKIYLNLDISDKDFNVQLIHELLHAQQFEENYSTIHFKNDTPEKVIRILSLVNNFILDLDVKLHQDSLVNIPSSGTSLKYQKYMEQMAKTHASKAKINSYVIRMLSVEIAYVYFIENKEYANKMIKFSKNLSDKITYKSELIINRASSYTYPNKKMYDKLVYDLLSILNFNQYRL